MINLPKIKDNNLFNQAFTHRSYLNETRQKVSSNERLEFLGDSVISFIVSNYLYLTYPQYNEGILTNLRSQLVNTGSLAQIAKELNFGVLLKLSKGEEDSKGRQNQSLLADSFEAFVGALFLDQGTEVVYKFLGDVLLPKAEQFVKNKAFKDPKSLLQERIQAKKQTSPMYKVAKESGPAHAKLFTVNVYSGGILLGTGEGKSKQQAEELAAKQALERKTK
ncbi:MAG TPA: ribonuclease III [Patescibacteria group bacterium]|nr:ribonuclease III [Patescibacteria group bacterium]